MCSGNQMNVGILHDCINVNDASMCEWPFNDELGLILTCC